MSHLKEKSLVGNIGKKEREKITISKEEYQNRVSELINNIHLENMFKEEKESEIQKKFGGNNG